MTYSNFCMTCGAENKYSGEKPASCSKCGTSFEISSSQSKYESKQPKIQEQDLPQRGFYQNFDIEPIGDDEINVQSNSSLKISQLAGSEKTREPRKYNKTKKSLKSLSNQFFKEGSNGK